MSENGKILGATLKATQAPGTSPKGVSVPPKTVPKTVSAKPAVAATTFPKFDGPVPGKAKSA